MLWRTSPTVWGHTKIVSTLGRMSSAMLKPGRLYYIVRWSLISPDSLSQLQYSCMRSMFMGRCSYWPNSRSIIYCSAYNSPPENLSLIHDIIGKGGDPGPDQTFPFHYIWFSQKKTENPVTKSGSNKLYIPMGRGYTHISTVVNRCSVVLVGAFKGNVS